MAKIRNDADKKRCFERNEKEKKENKAMNRPHIRNFNCPLPMVIGKDG